MAANTECIRSVEDLQRAIELGTWYDSEDDGDSETEDTDSGPCQNKNETPWRLLWCTEKEEDDPGFLKTESSVPRSPSEIVEELLNQLIEEEADPEEIDNGERGGQLELQDVSKKSETTECSAGTTSSTTSSVDRVVNGASCQPQANFDEGTSVDPERPKYYYIAYEMLTSERTYVQSLRLLEKVVHGAFKTTRMTRRNVLPENGRKEIFLNIGEIYALSFDLLQELEERLKHWDSSSVIADVIAKRAPFFKLYSMYSEKFDNAQVAYCKWLKSSKQFAELIKTIESSALCKGLPISSYMLCPIQRIPRYKLLLKEYLKHLPKGHPDVVNTEAALAAISETADHMDSRITDLESQAVVVRIQQSFTGKDNLIVPGRKYIGRGLVDFLPGGRRKQRILFLFTDILLIAASSSHGKYKIRHKLQLKNLLVQSLQQSSALKNGFCVAEEGTNKPFRFCTRSQEERNRWIKKLNRAKTVNSDHFTINKRSKYAAVLNDPEAHNSIRAVLNDPSFEHSQPSWVRRSQRLTHSTSLPIRLAMSTGMATPTYPSSFGRDEVDEPSANDEEVENLEVEEIVTEFEDDDEYRREKDSAAMALKPGIDNTLSSYMNQRSAKGDDWKRRWFVLTSHSLVCYQDHLHDEATVAIPLVGYKLSLPTATDGVKKQHVFKLTHSKYRTYFFQLPSSYDFERWCGVLKELLDFATPLVQ